MDYGLWMFMDYGLWITDYGLLLYFMVKGLWITVYGCLWITVYGGVLWLWVVIIEYKVRSSGNLRFSTIDSKILTFG